MKYKVSIILISWLLISTTKFKGSQLVGQTNLDDPVSYTIEAPESVKPGTEFIINTVFNIEPDWYVYAPIEMNTALGKIPTKVSFKTSEGLKKMGGLELPNKNGFFDTYSGKDIIMSQRFTVAKSTIPGKYNIQANVVYQTCNELICYPPVREKVVIVITVE